MQTFKDNAGRTWTIAVNVGSIKRVKALTGLNLLDVYEGKVIDQLARNPITLVDTLYAICKPDADAQRVSDVQFGEAMAGDAIEHATKALLDELISFSPNPRERAALGRVIQAMWKGLDKARDLLEAKLNQGDLEGTVDAAVNRAVQQALSDSSGSVPESPASSPSPSP